MEMYYEPENVYKYSFECYDKNNRSGMETWECVGQDRISE